MPDTGTVSRAMMLLAYVATAEPPLRVLEVAREMGLPNATTHRLLRQFVGMGLLRQMPGTHHYEPGIEMFRLGSLMARRADVIEVAMPALHRIATETGESCALGLYRAVDATMFFGAIAESPNPLRYHIELFKPASVLWGASGRAVLAHLPEELVMSLVARNPRSPTGLRPVRLPTLLAELARIREEGHSISRRGERVAGASGVSAAFFDAAGAVAGCLALTIPTMRYPQRQEARFARLMVQEAARLSQRLAETGLGVGASPKRRPRGL
jgi:DNA-binding IclR family transcriptional regulator